MSDTPTTQSTPAPSQAVTQFVEVWKANMLALHLAGRLTCLEADTLAELLEEAGARDEARQWLVFHREDSGDSCYGHSASIGDQAAAVNA